MFGQNAGWHFGAKQNFENIVACRTSTPEREEHRRGGNSNTAQVNDPQINLALDSASRLLYQTQRNDAEVVPNRVEFRWRSGDW